jgi:hemoglobin-like flavoprotein
MMLLVVPDGESASAGKEKERAGSVAAGTSVDAAAEATGHQETQAGSAGGHDDLGTRGDAWRADCAQLWKAVQALKNKSNKQAIDTSFSQEEVPGRNTEEQNTIAQVAPKKRSFGFGFFSSKSQNIVGDVTGLEASIVGKMANADDIHRSMPQTFEEMAKFQGTMVGANVQMVSIIVDNLDQLVYGVCDRDDGGLDKITRILALRMHREVSGSVNMKEYKLCLLASLRSLLPKRWSMQAEENWSELWDDVQKRLEPMLPLPNKYKKPVTTFVNGLDDAMVKTIGLEVFVRLFKQAPKAEGFFNQSNDRLCFIVGRAFKYGADIYQEPEKIATDVQALGMRHIMFQIATEYFKPFVEVVLSVVADHNNDPVLLQGLAWSLETVAAIMVHTIDTNSNPLLSAVLNNKPKQVRKVLGEVPRGKRQGAALGNAVWVKGQWV